MPRARLETQITGDATPFVQAVNQAEQRATGFDQKIQGLFRRDPSHRAERAISGLLGGLASGNVAGGIESIASKVSGLGLVVGVAIGGAAIVFQKLYGQLQETDKAAAALNKELARPLGLQSGLGPEGISKELEATSKAFDELADKRKSFASKLRAAGIAGAPEDWDETTGKVKPRIEDTDRKSAEKGEARLRSLTEARADAEQRIVDIRKLGITTGEREMEIAKIKLEAQKKSAAIQLEAGKGPLEAAIMARRVATVGQGEQLEITAANKLADAKERQLDIEIELAKLERAGGDPKDSKRFKAALELQEIQRQMLNANPQERKGLQLQKLLKENELASLSPQSQRAGFGTIARRWDDQDFQSGQRFGNNTFGSLAGRWDQGGAKPGLLNDIDRSILLKGILEEIRKIDLMPK
jgi:hypothetical protein